MHGIGNDFMIIDARESLPRLSADLIKLLSNRHLGVGFDQLAVIYRADSTDTAAYLKFWNSDGSVSTTCGNASRCIAEMLMNEKNVSKLNLKTDSGILTCERNEEGIVSINMGLPKFLWSEIPLAVECETLHLPLEGDPVATNVGNPHCTFFVDNAEKYDLNDYGKRFEKHPLFPHGTNIQIVNVTDKNCLRMRVWERGVGHTLASGSSACASAVAATRLGLTESPVTVHLDGGQLEIDWQESGVWMTGESTHVFSGYLTDEFLLSI